MSPMKPLVSEVRGLVMCVASKSCHYKVESGDFPGGLVVKTLPSKAGGVDSIPGPVAKTSRASEPKSQKIKQKQYYNKFSKDLNKWST